MIALDFSAIQLPLQTVDGAVRIFDPVRRKWLLLTPEEHVRQYLLQYLIQVLQYPPGLISVEKQITVGGRVRRYDLIVYSRLHQPWLLAECKAPEVPVSAATLQQIAAYQHFSQCRYLLLTNGPVTYCAEVEGAQLRWRSDLPAYDL